MNGPTREGRPPPKDSGRVTGTQAPVLRKGKTLSQTESTQNEGAIAGGSEHLSKDWGSWSSGPGTGLTPRVPVTQSKRPQCARKWGWEKGQFKSLVMPAGLGRRGHMSCQVCSTS